MHIISRKRLKDFWRQPRYADSERALRAWYADAKRSQWRTPAEIKRAIGSASIVSSDRVVFNICGNKYRLVVAIRYDKGCIYIRFVGTHPEYDQVDACTI